MKHVYPNDGQWIQVLRRGDKLICCDCLLVHKIEFKVMKNKIYFRAWRDNRATAQARRKFENANGRN